ncbi:MAG: response regulator transcription factor [Saprospiraceae bacterium]|nr:response regulator transcription factor [Saprospiraceae bacterium]
MQIIRTILADDQRIFLEGMKTVLSRSEKYCFDIVGVAHDGEELLHMIRRKPIELLILDLNLADKDGLEVMSSIARERIPVQILVFTVYDEPKIIKSALKNGANGYILKDRGIEELFFAIEEVLNNQTYLGEGVQLAENNHHRTVPGKQQTDFHLEDRFVKKYHLTKREMEILRLITHALSNKEIAKELYISDQTVSVHRKNIMRKLGVSNTAGLIKAAYEFSLV